VHSCCNRNRQPPTLRPNKPLQYAQLAHQPVHRQPPGSGVHPCTAPCTRPCRPTTQCKSLTGLNLPSVLHRSMHAVRQRPVHSQRQLATAVQPIAARTSTAACATVAQVCHTVSSPPASAAACIWSASLHSTVRTAERVHPAAWISNRFQLAIRLAAVHAHGSAATRTPNDQPWPAGVHTIAANSPHRNAPSGQQPVTPLCVQPDHHRTHYPRASWRAWPRNSCARAVAQLSEHRTGSSAHQQHQLHRRSSTLRITSVAATPSFSTENATEQGIVNC